MFEESDAGHRRRDREARARAKAEATRRALLDLLREGPMSGRELRTRLAADASVSVVNYHLAVLVSDREVVAEDGLYRLA
jgi:predicted transcriptional regulator